MPLQNRVSPFGELFATSARGTLMGNRGGRLHDDKRKLTSRHWTSKVWICCRLEFNNRHRDVWGDGYTELFFLDEVTGLTAGHRPCFECRRKDAERFAVLFSGKKPRATAAIMDETLHAQRLNGKAKRTHGLAIDRLPDGAMVALDGDAFAVRGSRLLRWTPSGYFRIGSASTWHRGRRAHAPVNSIRACARLHAALARQRGALNRAAMCRVGL